MTTHLQNELLYTIARFIVEDSMPWALAREKAREIYGSSHFAMPTGQAIESAVRETWEIFDPEGHRRLLREKRLAACSVLALFEKFDAYLAGAVLNGAAGPETSIRIEIFDDDMKAVECALMDAQIPFDAIDPESQSEPQPIESIGFLYKTQQKTLEAVRVEIFSTKHRGANSRRTKPDRFQSPWEALGRISLAALKEQLDF